MLIAKVSAATEAIELWHAEQPMISATCPSLHLAIPDLLDVPGFGFALVKLRTTASDC